MQLKDQAVLSVMPHTLLTPPLGSDSVIVDFKSLDHMEEPTNA